VLVVLLALQLDQTPVFKEVTPYLVALLVRVADTDVAGTSLAQASPAVMAGLVAVVEMDGLAVLEIHLALHQAKGTMVRQQGAHHILAAVVVAERLLLRLQLVQILEQMAALEQRLHFPVAA